MSIEALAALVAGARRLVAFTGAGISTESGIPDFRGPQGLWTKVDPKDFTIQKYLADPAHRRRVWQMRLEHADQRYEPNAGHRALAALERMGILDCVVTQNIDGLHQAAGSTTVFEVHGTTRQIKCLSCGRRFEPDPVFERVRTGDPDPSCEICGGILKSATISFGEPMPLDVVRAGSERLAAADVCVVVGSSLVVYPAAAMPLETLRAGGRLAIVNNEPTPFDDEADVVVHASAGEVLTQVVERVAALRG